MESSFVAIDFETATRHHICSVGIITVENRKIVDEYHTLIQPPNNDYHLRNIQVHGITPKDTQNSPLFSEIYPKIRERIAGKIPVAHNESFDRNTLVKTMLDYNLDYADLEFPDRWECTLKIYRNKGYKPAGLSACCEVNKIELLHHNSLSDAKACAKLYLLAGI